MFKKYLLSYFLVISSFFVQSQDIAESRPQFSASISDQINGLIYGRGLNTSVWGIQIKNLNNGHILFESNAFSPVIPASNMKLYTTAAALELLGPHYRYQTDVYLRGQIGSGALNGDVIVRGVGDPTFGRRDHLMELERTFTEWAQSLKNMGIYTINGDLIGDDNFFDDDAFGANWQESDKNQWYGAEMGALMMHNNVADIIVKSGGRGKRANLEIAPKSDNIILLNETGGNDKWIQVNSEYRKDGKQIIRVTGNYADSQTFRYQVPVRNSTLYFLSVMKRVLSENGIQLLGQTVDVDEVMNKPIYRRNNDMVRFATHVSPELQEILKEINKDSNNQYAENLLKTIGAYNSESVWDGIDVPATTAAGGEVVRKFAERIGIELNDYSFADGSGLSRNNRVTPTGTIKLLEYFWYHKDSEIRDAFYNSLSIAGVDGTTKRRMRGTMAQGNVRAKTGYINEVRALSGYIRTAYNTPIAFSIICNDHALSKDAIDRIIDKIMVLIAESRM